MFFEDIYMVNRPKVNENGSIYDPITGTGMILYDGLCHKTLDNIMKLYK